jgi:hypothetical protein
MLITYENKLWLKRTLTENAEFSLSVGPCQASLTLKADDFSVVHKNGSTTVTLGRLLSKEDLRSLAWAASTAADEIEKRQSEASSYVTVTSDAASLVMLEPSG